MSFLIDSDIIKNEEDDEIAIVQIINDEVEGQYRPVIGGYHSENMSEKFTVRFKLVGDYYFKLINHPNNPGICKIKIVEEKPLSLLITDF